jgi:hypothetical protein
MHAARHLITLGLTARHPNRPLNPLNPVYGPVRWCGGEQPRGGPYPDLEPRPQVIRNRHPKKKRKAVGDPIREPR